VMQRFDVSDRTARSRRIESHHRGTRSSTLTP
jgi:hypothetical protein